MQDGADGVLDALEGELVLGRRGVGVAPGVEDVAHELAVERDSPIIEAKAMTRVRAPSSRRRLAGTRRGDLA